MRGLSDGGVERDPGLNWRDSAVTLITAQHGVDRIEHRDVNDGHRATGTDGPKLLAEGAQFARRHRSVIESAGIDCNLVPAVDGIEPGFGGLKLGDVLGSVKARTKNVAERLRFSANNERQAKSQKSG